MRPFLVSVLGSVLGVVMMSGVVFAEGGFAGDIQLPDNHVRFSEESFLEGTTVRVYVTALNNGSRDLLGAVRLTVNGQQVGSDQPISVLFGRTDSIFIDWPLSSPGKKNVKVTIIPWDPGDDNPANNVVERTVTVIADTDHDGNPNVSDADDDNDGVSDENDAFPLDASESVDTDGDKIGNNKDNDDDNDGVVDAEDVFPLDGDESLDTDGDEIGNNADEDDDGDGLADVEEDILGTDKLVVDTDGDGVNDDKDDFPLDPEESEDFDGDGLGDKNSDDDDDNDGVVDEQDSHPKNKGPVLTPSRIHISGVRGREVVLALPEAVDEDGRIARYELLDREGNVVKDIESKDLESGADQELENGVKLKKGKFVTSFENEGKYKYSLRVYDDKGEFRTADYTVDVFKSNLRWWLLSLVFVLLLALVVGFKYLRKAENQK